MDDINLVASTLNDEDIKIEKIPTRHLIVHKLTVNLESAREVVEKDKTKFFAKLGFLKPKHKEIECESILLFYESFLIAKAKYLLDYYEKKKYRIKVGEKATQVEIFNQVLEPFVPSGKVDRFLKRSRKEIVLEGEERVNYERTKEIALNRKGHEINPAKLPNGPFELEPRRVLIEWRERVRDLDLSLVDTIRDIICERPSNVGRVVKEFFEVTEHSVVYTPIYEARCRHLKTKEIKIIPISGVTNELLFL
jgi:hypothetical protein